MNLLSQMYASRQDGGGSQYGPGYSTSPRAQYLQGYVPSPRTVAVVTTSDPSQFSPLLVPVSVLPTASLQNYSSPHLQTSPRKYMSEDRLYVTGTSNYNSQSMNVMSSSQQPSHYASYLPRDHESHRQPLYPGPSPSNGNPYESEHYDTHTSYLNKWGMRNLSPRSSRSSLTRAGDAASEKYVEVPVEKIVLQDREVPVDRIVQKEVIKEIPVDRPIDRFKTITVEKVVRNEVPVFVDKIVKEEVQVPVEKVVAGASENGFFREVEKVRIQEKFIEIPVEKLVEKEIAVPVDKIVEKVVEIPVERVVVKEVPVEVEKVVIKEVPIPMEILEEDEDGLSLRTSNGYHPSKASTESEEANQPPKADQHVVSLLPKERCADSCLMVGNGDARNPQHVYTENCVLKTQIARLESQLSRFQLATSIPLLYCDVVDNDVALLTWNAIATATTYRLQMLPLLDVNPLRDEDFHTLYVGPHCAFRFPDLQGGFRYYFRVRAENECVHTAWSLMCNKLLPRDPKNISQGSC
ncbi:hypothetical protein GUITHDRAFT_102159 [Guillardia theta CCMP2712]|uniref:Fibronectin type-III domain-containing protein n=1 Tax=Guillardia theta (strain CCMP2712) TaxID=905079 RepID=L1JV44_GUITC|nr:hypothetical protein GUITHDRAFT_102159 [Guillardia theta CCMP2712]EKX52257.1 hypothetical protein GUITHDRAFT_102159 [Guillardia theta CCMP2712]|mmetsp:Transcript_15863/g.53060  ORF Transcript_15863/g.53060 Transcript_15863/m.53060 type:complete len:522 (-) Transcript_15863:2231-3796(-)|eukprot:XP_005839237.1 hypothetical protein GUITHDRAFT_102159 [Guillardia theta CCMP2712]